MADSYFADPTGDVGVYVPFNITDLPLTTWLTLREIMFGV
jgi:hypothetical protein